MKLTLEGIKNASAWNGFKLPAFDIEKMCETTKQTPVWIHFGSGHCFCFVKLIPPVGTIFNK